MLITWMNKAFPIFQCCNIALYCSLFVIHTRKATPEGRPSCASSASVYESLLFSALISV